MTATARSKPSAARDVKITRVIDAPRGLVFKAWIDPKHMAQWWGPHGFTNPVCELDARPGGAIRIHMRAPDGVVHPMSGTFREVVEPELLVFTAVAEDQEGNAVLEALTTVTFARQGSKTRLTVHAKAVGLAPVAPQMLAGMEAGWTQSLERLAALVKKPDYQGTPSSSRTLERTKMRAHRIVSRDEWLAARKAHLKNEKALTRMRDLISAERRALPWVKVEKEYVFDTPKGKKTLADLFGRNSQLIIHHFMWRHDLDMGCVSCSLEADHAEGALMHLENHDVSYVRVSRAPLAKLEAYKKRLGWKAKWVSSYANDFNFDYHVSFSKEDMAKDELHYNYQMIENEYGLDEMPGLSVFTKDEAGNVFHTYSSYARGNEEVIGAFIYLDITPNGRNETEIMDWVKRNDEYDAQAGAQSCCHTSRRA